MTHLVAQHQVVAPRHLELPSLVEPGRSRVVQDDGRPLDVLACRQLGPVVHGHLAAMGAHVAQGSGRWQRPPIGRFGHLGFGRRHHLDALHLDDASRGEVAEKVAISLLEGGGHVHAGMPFHLYGVFLPGKAQVAQPPTDGHALGCDAFG